MAHIADVERALCPHKRFPGPCSCDGQAYLDMTAGILSVICRSCGKECTDCMNGTTDEAIDAWEEMIRRERGEKGKADGQG